MVELTALSEPAVSVIIPAFNRANSIRIAVESVLRQSFTDFELLVVDDGSTDGTLKALNDIADPRLRCLSNTSNMGASAARNTGIRAARGEWIAFQDSDDEWLPEKLARQMVRLRDAGPETVACYCGMVIVDRPAGATRMNLRYWPPASIVDNIEGNISRAILVHSLVSTQTLVARRSALQAIGGFDEALPALEDWDCAIRLSRLGPFAFVDEPLVHQFFLDNFITRSQEKRARARLMMIEKHTPLYEDQEDKLVQQWLSVAGDFRRLGKMVEARAALARAQQLRPFHPAIWARLFFVAALSVMSWGHDRSN